MALPSGMSENPGQVSSLSSRLICARCGCEPTILNPEKITRGEMVSITAECHGERETKMIAWKDLTFTQSFFEGSDGNA